MRRLWRCLTWRFRGKPVVKYPGYNCGCCGAWVTSPFEVRDYKASWIDAWGLCLKCRIRSIGKYKED